MTHEMPAYADNATHKLHVVIHGLICIRLSERDRTLTLHIPGVPMHVYRVGNFSDLRALPTGHDYELGGVQVGHFSICHDDLQKKSVALSLQDRGLHFRPHGTFATVRLPWPADMKAVRPLNSGPDPLFNEGVNPREARIHHVRDV